MRSSCLVMLILLLLNLLLGGVAFDYCLDSILGVDIPWYSDTVAGMFLGEIAIPAAVICLIVNSAGVRTPYIPRSR